MNALTNARRVITNLACSRGNLLVANDGTRYIDLFTNIASLPLGYNHPDLIRLMSQPEIVSMAINRPATNLFPPEQFLELLKETFPKISPHDHGYIWLGSSGSEAVEAAMKHCSRKRKSTNFLSFEGGFHGRTIGALSMTNTNPLWKQGFPQLPTLTAPFPTSDDVNDCVERTRELISANHVAGVFIEPIQCEGGDRMADPTFFRKIRALCTMYDIPFVVDEVQTNMGTGKMWAHDHWDLQEPPDIVVFGKKMQIAGFFAADHMQPPKSDEYAYNSTWAGDPFRGMILKSILEIIERDNLYEISSRAGNKLFDRLRTMQGVQNVRNINAFGAFDLADSCTIGRDEFLKMLQASGLILGACGEKSIRVRPSLVFDEHIADSVIDILALRLS